jgi:hypothetical protein
MCADLANNKPGQSVTSKSADIWLKSPVKSFVRDLLGVKSEDASWNKGAKGEKTVAKQLEKLGDGFYVLHSVTRSESGTDIDHVVIGPTGVFSLNTKDHIGKAVTVYEYMIYVGGVKTSYIKASESEGRIATRLLSAACGQNVFVQPVIVVMCDNFVVKGHPEHVRVVTRRGITEWLKTQPVILEQQQVEAIYAVARQSSTWL